MSVADQRHDVNVEGYLASITDEQTVSDARTIIGIMQRITGCQPVLYGIGTIGFGTYRYEYTSGRKGEAHILAFYPRKGKTTIYLMDGTRRYAELLSKLGKHTITGYCVYIKRLADIDLAVLTRILEESYANIHAKSQNGAIDRILWQSQE